MKGGNRIAASLLLMPGAIFGQTKQAAPEQGDSTVSCVERLEIPGYPARQHGIVVKGRSPFQLPLPWMEVGNG